MNLCRFLNHNQQDICAAVLGLVVVIVGRLVFFRGRDLVTGHVSKHPKPTGLHERLLIGRRHRHIEPVHVGDEHRTLVDGRKGV